MSDFNILGKLHRSIGGASRAYVFCAALNLFVQVGWREALSYQRRESTLDDIFEFQTLPAIRNA